MLGLFLGTFITALAAKQSDGNAIAVAYDTKRYHFLLSGDQSNGVLLRDRIEAKGLSSRSRVWNTREFHLFRQEFY